MRRRHLLPAGALAAALAGCRATRPSDIPSPAPTDAIVAIKAFALPVNRALESLGHHAWVELERPGAVVWERIESGGPFGIVHADLAAEAAHLDLASATARSGRRRAAGVRGGTVGRRGSGGLPSPRVRS